jgi:hypothetical protein
MKTKNTEKLVPVSTTRIDPVIVPEHTIESPTTGDMAIDQSALVKDTRTYREIFEAGMASGAFDDCANPAQVNKAIAAIKGNGKVCVYMVSEVAHQWVRTDDPAGWVRKTEAELLAHPFVAGVGHARVKNTAILDPIEEAALKAQAVALVVLKDNPAIAPLLDAINAKLKAHELALLEESTKQASVKKRAATLEAVKALLLANDKTGGKAFLIHIFENGEAYAITDEARQAMLDRTADLA